MRPILQSLTRVFLLCLAVGWFSFFQFPRERAVSLALLAGLSVAAGAIQLGVRLELRQIESNGQGTPRATMARRLTLFFSLLTLLVGGLLLGRFFPTAPALACLVAFSAVWIPAGIVWRLAPRAAPIAPAFSVAARGSFFEMAVGAIAAAASPWLLTSAAGIGFLAAVLASGAFMIVTAWVAACRVKSL